MIDFNRLIRLSNRVGADPPRFSLTAQLVKPPAFMLGGRTDQYFAAVFFASIPVIDKVPIHPAALGAALRVESRFKQLSAPFTGIQSGVFIKKIHPPHLLFHRAHTRQCYHFSGRRQDPALTDSRRRPDNPAILQVQPFQSPCSVHQMSAIDS